MSVEPAFDRETGHRYALRLRGKPSEMNEPGWSVDWADAPWPFKIYEGGQRVALPACAPSWAASRDSLPWRALGRILQLSVGCIRTRVRNSSTMPPAVRAEASSRRALASGGALYPSEVYVCAADALQRSVYHYDAARHELVALPVDEVAATLAAALGEVIAAGTVCFVVTNFFWKNFCKYGDFGYRLSAVDLGIAASRLQRVVQSELGSARLRVDFDDRALNGLLGLDDQDESAYAVVLARTGGEPLAPIVDPTLAQPARSKQKSRIVKRSAAYAAMHESTLAGSREFGAYQEGPERTWQAFLDARSEAPVSHLPEVRPLRDLARAIERRASDGPRFVPNALSIESLAFVLAEAAAGVKRVSEVNGGLPLPRVHLAVIVQRVGNLPPGAYLRDAESGSLRRVHTAELGLELQACSNLQNINLDLAAFTVHCVGEVDLRNSARGNRTYRIQQLVVGAALDAAALACAELGIAAHPMLGFDAGQLDALYGLTDTGFGVLAQTVVGTARLGGHLEGAIYP